VPEEAGMIGFLGQVILRTHHEIAFQETVRSKLHPRRYINDLPRPYREIISDLPEPLRPPFEDMSATLKRPSRARAANLQTLSPAHKMMHSPRRLRPHHRPRPIRPQKSPTSAASIQTIRHSTPASTPITDSLHSRRVHGRAYPPSARHPGMHSRFRRRSSPHRPHTS
jgi:hypothetical protein